MGTYTSSQKKEFVNEITQNIPNYNFKTKYDNLFNGKNGYIFSKEFILEDIKQFVNKMTSCQEKGDKL